METGKSTSGEQPTSGWPLAEAEPRPEEAQSAEVPTPGEGPGSGERSSVDGLGLGAVVTGILLLSPVAIVLGHLALRRAKRRPAQSRTLAIAGTILGYLGLLVTVGAVVAYTTTLGPELDRASADAHAQADVTAVGNAVAVALESDATLPEVAVADGSYTVGDTELEALLDGERTLELTGTSRTDWCVELGYESGDLSTVSYVGTAGFRDAACA
ncbi:DUF4190 domain-containing protein [Demequina sp. NBRC 110054]|uniref:DUF4190 domain-containing protein n=1 Tax=Demequina sp. NBRC 110054 TaxID=1570343 RepID=UPI000A051536|nr:DUF4190 domain-containing protein [Demequina sp. NBRC 110054]